MPRADYIERERQWRNNAEQLLTLVPRRITLMWTIALMALFTLLLILAAAVAVAIRARNMQYLAVAATSGAKAPRVTDKPVHVMFCFVDHFEPAWGKVDLATQRARVDRWCLDYRKLADAHHRCRRTATAAQLLLSRRGISRRASEKLASLCADGYGEIEIHLHHDDDTPENFKLTIDRFNKLLHERHNALPRDPRDRPTALRFYPRQLVPGQFTRRRTLVRYQQRADPAARAWLLRRLHPALGAERNADAHDQRDLLRDRRPAPNPSRTIRVSGCASVASPAAIC
jgi:hypothetical protein